MNLLTFIAGSTLTFAAAPAAFPAGEGWTLKYRMVPRSAGHSVLSFDAVAEGDAYRVTVGALTTAAWSADVYTWASWVERAAEVYDLDRGQLTVLANPRSAQPGYDGRSLAARTLEDCRAAFAAFSSARGVQRRYKIGEREMEFNSTTEIIRQITYWQAQVDAENVAAGKRPATSGRILTRI